MYPTRPAPRVFVIRSPAIVVAGVPAENDATYVMRLRGQTSIENTQAAWHA
jgi:hypothetical protein